MDKNYIVYHCHSDYSLLDSCTKFRDYADLALKNGQKAIASTEHGKPLGWVSKKMYCDRREAICYALAEAAADDVILIAGKGHENYQILKDRTIHFDDKEVVMEY